MLSKRISSKVEEMDRRVSLWTAENCETGKSSQFDSNIKKIRSIAEMKNHRILRRPSPMWRTWMEETERQRETETETLNKTNESSKFRISADASSLILFGFGGFWCFRTYEMVFTEPGPPVIVIDGLEGRQCVETINIHYYNSFFFAFYLPFFYMKVRGGVPFQRIELQSAKSNRPPKGQFDGQFRFIESEVKFNRRTECKTRWQCQVTTVDDAARPISLLLSRSLPGSNSIFDFN